MTKQERTANVLKKWRGDEKEWDYLFGFLLTPEICGYDEGILDGCLIAQRIDELKTAMFAKLKK